MLSTAKTSLQAIIDEPLPDNPEFYEKLDTGSEYEGRRLTAYLPTAKGSKILANYYNRKYPGINIEIIDHSDSISLSLSRFLTDYKRGIIPLKNDPTGFVLYCSGHTTPIIMSKNNIIILDSSDSDGVDRVYKTIADQEKEFNFFLNYGTRQSDKYSCSIDAIAILKDALRIPDFIDLIKIRTKENFPNGSKESDFFSPIKRMGMSISDLSSAPYVKDDKEILTSDNFHQFYLPEELLKLAQRPSFIRDSNPDYDRPLTTSKRGETLRTSLAKQYLEVPHLNYYLLIKGYDYAKSINRAVSEAGPASVSEPKAQTLNTTRRRGMNCIIL